MTEVFQPLEENKICQKCGAENRAGNLYCTRCGAPLQKAAAQEEDPLAKGLPDWTLEPPQTVIRRKVKL